MIDKITKARTGLVLDHPFFGSLILRMKMIEDNNIKTMCTNGSQIRYNKQFVDEISQNECKGVLCHEVMHIACMHHLRRGNRDHKLWNISGDYVINQILVDSGEVIPEGGLLDQRFKNMSTEAVYSILQRESARDDKGGNEKGSGGGGDSGDGEQNEQGEQMEGEEEQEEQKGNGSDNKERQRQEQAASWGEVEDATNDDGSALSESEISQAEQEVKVSIAQAMNQAKMAGKIGAGIRQFAEGILTPKINWEDELRRFINDMAKNEYSWMPPNRRYIHKGIYLPSLKSEVLKEAVIVVDTSGSVDDEVVRQFIGEFNAILTTIKFQKVHLWSCDTQVYEVGEYDMAEEINYDKLPGGGGTDFRPPFDLIEERDINPSVVIYLTDMWCYRFPDTPSYPVLWVQYGDCNNNPPFGELIKIQ